MGNAHLISIYKERNMQTSPNDGDDEMGPKVESEKQNPLAKV